MVDFITPKNNGTNSCDISRTMLPIFLQITKLEHTIYKLGEDFDREQFYSKFGDGSTFPQVILNDQNHLGGCTETVNYLKENKVI